MRKSTLALSCIVPLSSLAVQYSNAAVSFSYAADSHSYTGVVGSTVSVSIYLDETLTGTSTDLITPDGGVATAGAAVNATGTAGGGASSIVSPAYTAASPFTATANSVYYNQGAGNNVEFTELASPGSDGFAVPATTEVLLGNLAITVGSGTTSYYLTSLNDDTIAGGFGGAGDGNTLAANGTDFDAPNVAFTGADATGLLAPFTFTVAPVPEPASITLLSLGGMMLLSRRRSV